MEYNYILSDSSVVTTDYKQKELQLQNDLLDTNQIYIISVTYTTQNCESFFIIT